MMNKRFSLVLSTVLLGSAIAFHSSSNYQAKAGSTLPSPLLQVTDSWGLATLSPSTAIAAATNTIAAGTTFNTDLKQDLSTGKNKNQDRFTLAVKTGWFGGNSILKGAQVQGHLEDVVKAARGKKAKMNLVFDAIVLKNGDQYPADVVLVNTQMQTKTQGKFLQNAGIILGGAVAGHFVGNKAKFKHGALAGGAAAAAFVLSSPGGEVVLKKGTDVKLKFKSAFAP